jgi:hypothetical protein
VTFAQWLLLAVYGVGMMALGDNPTIGFAFAFVGAIAATVTWPDMMRARRAERRRARRNVHPPR